MRYLALSSAVVLVVAGVACKPTPPASSGTVSTAAAPAESAAPVTSAPPAAAAAQGSNAFTGTIAETMDSGGYTYARLQGGPDDVWVAAPPFDAKVGETISVSLDMRMDNFQSKTLNRTFPLIYFVQAVARNGQPVSAAAAAAPPTLMNSHGPSAAPAPVAKTTPPAGGLSIADVFAKKAALSGKPVTVRGTVVKFNGGIMDRNWLHIQDGSGSADAKNNDLTITTDAQAKVGDVVTLTGVVGTDKDFGAGYAYDVIVEKAALK